MRFPRAKLASLYIGSLLIGSSLAAPAISFATDIQPSGDLGIAGIEAESVESTPMPTQNQTEPVSNTLSNEQVVANPPANEQTTTTVVEQTVPVAAPTATSNDTAKSSEPKRYDVTYLDEKSDEQVARQILAVQPNTAELKAGWYTINEGIELKAGWFVLSENIELKAPLTIEGDVRIIFTPGHTLKAMQGIRVKKDSRLTLYAQKAGAGTLEVHGGITLQLTKEQQEEHDEWLARELEVNPEFKEEKPQLLYVVPCYDVVAGDHEPWPVDAPTPDPDPDHAPKHVDKPDFKEALVSKAYLVVRPSAHTMKQEDGFLLIEDGHFTCTACDGWFADSEGHERVEKPLPLAADAESITISFDANGGSGYMEPMAVTAGEAFELPECGFEPPEGMVFSSWSLGRAGSKVSVPTDTTLRAWWKKDTSVGGNTDQNPSQQTDDGGSGSASQQGGSSSASGTSGSGSSTNNTGTQSNAGTQNNTTNTTGNTTGNTTNNSTNNTPSNNASNSSTTNNGSSTSKKDGSPDTGDHADRWSGVTLGCALVGSALVLVGKVEGDA